MIAVPFPTVHPRTLAIGPTCAEILLTADRPHRTLRAHTEVTGEESVREGTLEEKIVEYGSGLVELPNSEFAKADGALTCRSLILPLIR